MLLEDAVQDAESSLSILMTRALWVQPMPSAWRQKAHSGLNSRREAIPMGLRKK